MLETVSIMGPARFGVPFTQALTAPMLGALEARDAFLRLREVDRWHAVENARQLHIEQCQLVGRLLLHP